MPVKITNKSGVKGVYYVKKSRNWYVRIDQSHIGAYDNFDDAVKRRYEEEIKRSTAYIYLKKKGLI